MDAERIRRLNGREDRAGGRYVLYWAQANRRVAFNHALAYAAERANAAGLPLLVYEGLTFDYPHANARLHGFVLEGAPDTARGVTELGAGYFFYLRKGPGDPNDIVFRLAGHATCVVTDDYPTFLPARYNQSAPPKMAVPVYAVDSSCIVPMAFHEKREYGAYTIRPKIHRVLDRYLRPIETPALRHHWRDSLLPEGLAGLRTEVTADNAAALTEACRLECAVAPAIGFRGGYEQARKRLERFLDSRLARYSADAGKPTKHATSGLSPYLHFGHISALEVALSVREHAQANKLMAEDFLEQLIVRRELAFNFARYARDREGFGDLPDWCRATMAKHARDRRPYLYTPEQFESADTHDPLWNAAQKELLLRGVIHGYYRMYWAKKIIEWSPTYEEALATMLRLHDIYALDGRDPNTYTNILWCFGLHDRPWGERPIFGMLRYMSFDGMRRKTDTDGYIKEISYIEKTGKDPFSL